MIGRARRIAVMAASLFALAMPMHAQDATSSVSFDGIGFSFSHELGRSVNILRVPRQRLGETPEGEASPAHVVFSLYGRQAESRRVPGPWDVPGTVHAYRTTALDGYPQATSQLTALQRLLEERPDPATLGAFAADGSVELPYLPIPGAGQPIAARIGYIDTPELAGVAYVTGFRQDTFPFARDDFWYTFQGLSTDGRWYVAVDWVISANMFPRTVSDADARRVANSASRWERYIRDSQATLDAGTPADFTPSLDALDALVRSIEFDSVTPPSPSPQPIDAAVASEQPPTPSGSTAP